MAPAWGKLLPAATSLSPQGDVPHGACGNERSCLEWPCRRLWLTWGCLPARGQGRVSTVVWLCPPAPWCLVGGAWNSPGAVTLQYKDRSLDEHVWVLSFLPVQAGAGSARPSGLIPLAGTG